MFEPDRSPDDYLKMLGSVPLIILMYKVEFIPIYGLQRGLRVNGKSSSLLLVFFILLFFICPQGSLAGPWGNHSKRGPRSPPLPPPAIHFSIALKSQTLSRK